MIEWAIATLILFVLFMTYLGWLFLFTVMEVVVNSVIIYAIFLRSYVEIFRENKFPIYLGGAAVAMIAYLLAGNFLSGILVWGVTTYLCLAFACAQLIYLVHREIEKRRKKNKS